MINAQHWLHVLNSDLTSKTFKANPQCCRGNITTAAAVQPSSELLPIVFTGAKCCLTVHILGIFVFGYIYLLCVLRVFYAYCLSYCPPEASAARGC